MAAPHPVRHPIFARVYLLISRHAEQGGASEHRDQLLAGLSGKVIEVGAGNGLNFAHYPGDVERVLAVEPEPLLRREAKRLAGTAPVRVEVVDGFADSLPAEDGSFDSGIASLVLCSVPDQQAALAELRRVIRPGGELRFYEHVVSHTPRSARLQRLADRVFWPHVGGGCHLARDTAEAIDRAGFRIETISRFPFAPGPGWLALPHILGTARRPA